MARKFNAHPLNVLGDFYVEDGCCTRCGIPDIFAPSLFGGIGPTEPHCWIKQQPQTHAEINSMIDTMAHQELDCIRYSGSEPKVSSMLIKAGCSEMIDE